jgi:outer membrane protein TolC
LLQRRPDVAAAERRTAQANAQIGVAQAAWFPDIILGAQAGFRSGQWAQWLTAPASFWSLGPALALTIFDGGAREAELKRARAGYEAQAAAYRQTVLLALREVEDFLVQLHVLGLEQVTQGRALAAARESLQQSNYDIAQAEAQYRQAQALLQSSRSAFFPTVGTSASFTRSGTGRGGSASDISGLGSFGGDNPSNQYGLSGDVSWEPDLWGRVRRSVESSRAGVEASAADVGATRLSLQSILVQTYFRLRIMDAEKRLLHPTVDAYQRSVTMNQNR